jgi:hypothetical protein
MLAEVTDPRVDPDRRAWHRAQATSDPDEEIAAELERSAGRAQARGGLAAAAAFLDRSAAMTVDPARQADRALAAAQAKYQAGAPDAAYDLLARAEAGPPDMLVRARASLLRGQMAFASGHSADASTLLLATAGQFEPVDPRLARETYLDALAAATFVGRLAGSAGLPEITAAARAGPAAPQPPRAADLLLDGLALLITDGYPAGAPALRRAVSAFCRGDVAPEDEIRWSFVACHSAHDLWDDEAGMSSPRGISSSLATSAPSPCCPSRWLSGSACTCTRASSRRPVRWSGRLWPSPRRRAATCPPTAPWPSRAGRAVSPRRPS